MFLNLKNFIARNCGAAALMVTTVAISAVSSQAAILNYNVSYTGTGASTTVTGSGTFQITTVGLTGTITGFSFSDTITGTSGSSTYSYALANLLSVNSVVVGGTVANPTLATIQLTTNYVAGTNPAFGSANFVGQYASANPGAGSTSTNPAVSLGITSGSITITPAAVPEPATFALFGLGLAAFTGSKLRRRFLR